MPSYVKDTNDFINKINTVKSIQKKPIKNGCEIIIYKYSKCRGTISCKESIRKLLKENYKHQSYNKVLSINTYIE